MANDQGGWGFEVVSRHVATLPFKFSDPRAVIHRIEVDINVALLVVGDPDNGGYEWVIHHNDAVVGYSDAGYGSSDIALRDGLVAYHGLGGAAALAAGGWTGRYCPAS